MEWSTAIVGVPGCRNKPTVSVGDYIVLDGGYWIWPLADNTILHLSELETGGVQLLGHQVTSPPEQHRVVLLVQNIKENPFTVNELLRNVGVV